MVGVSVVQVSHCLGFCADYVKAAQRLLAAAYVLSYE